MLFYTYSWCQDNALEFYPLKLVENVSETAVRKMQKLDSIAHKDFFFITNYKDNHGLFFVKKEKQNWVVYDFELSLNWGPNTTVKMINLESNRFVSVQLYRSPPGTCSTIYGILVLLDTTNSTSVSFFNYNQMDCKEGKTKECKASFSIKDNFLNINSSKANEDGLDCIKSGKYHYTNGKFVLAN